MLDKNFAEKMMRCVEEAQTVKTAVVSATDEQLWESLQEFVDNRQEYCKQLCAQFEHIDNIIRTGHMDAAFRALGAPAVSALGAFNEGLLEILNIMEDLSDNDIDGYKEIRIRACNVQVEFYEAIMSIAA